MTTFLCEPFDDERFWELPARTRENLIYREITTARQLVDLYMSGGLKAIAYTFDPDNKPLLPYNAAEQIERVFGLKRMRINAYNNNWTTQT